MLSLICWTQLAASPPPATHERQVAQLVLLSSKPKLRISYVSTFAHAESAAKSCNVQHGMTRRGRSAAEARCAVPRGVTSDMSSEGVSLGSSFTGIALLGGMGCSPGTAWQHWTPSGRLGLQPSCCSESRSRSPGKSPPLQGTRWCSHCWRREPSGRYRRGRTCGSRHMIAHRQWTHCRVAETEQRWECCGRPICRTCSGSYPFE